MALRDKLFGKKNASSGQELVAVYGYMFLKEIVMADECHILAFFAENFFKKTQPNSIPFINLMHQKDIQMELMVELFPDDKVEKQRQPVWVSQKLMMWLNLSHGIGFNNNNYERIFVTPVLESPYGKIGNYYVLGMYFHMK